MLFTGVLYFSFLIAGLIAYYLMPKKVRWTILLAMSYTYYFSFRLKGAFFILCTTITVYMIGRLLDSITEKTSRYLELKKEILTKEERNLWKSKAKKKKKFAVVLALVINFGILAALKYAGIVFSGFSIVMPLGISFFTFQAISYVIDVYQGKYKCEKNIFKFALFVSFFPQIMQGPIGRFDRLAPQLFRGNDYSLRNIQFGLQRIGWGLFKKLVIADRAGVFVDVVFQSADKYNGAVSVMALLMYSVQLYMDFSGGIDIVIGTAEMFGIKMDENFRQPYFSKSIGEFWRRWHITLGAWMKDYVFYPFSLSKGFHKMTKYGKKYLGNHIGRTLPICFANILIFFIVGIWHGSELRFIIYGLYNGIIIATSNMLSPVYKTGLEKLHINPEKTWWKIVQIIRTFLLVNLGWIFDCSVNGTRMALHTFGVVISNPDFGQFNAATIAEIGLFTRDYVVIVFGCILVFVISVLKERNVMIRENIAARPLVLRWVIYYGLFLSIIVLGYIVECSEFMYAAF